MFSHALRSAFPSIPCEPLLVKAQPKFGDYQCNNAMALHKEHGAGLGYKNPSEMAEAIKANLPENDILGKVDVSPQGFITVKINDDWITKQVTSILTSGVSYEAHPKSRVVVDFSSPNIAKDMHVGHLRSTIMGESCCRILEFCGHEVHRINHVGDWGTQFGMLIEYMKETYPDFANNLPEISDLQEFYKASKKRFDDDENFKDRARKMVVALQGGDKVALDAWQKICEVSRKCFMQIYDRLGIRVYERGESFYNGMIPDVVREMEQRGLIVESQGAKCCFTPRVCEIPLMAVKGDGGFGYDSTDLAAIYHRLFQMRADWLIYVTDMGQETHFFMIFDAAEQAGWHRPPATRCDHMGFGVVQGDDKKKFKTRSGDTVKLADLLDEAVSRALEEIKNRVAEQEKTGGEVFLKTDKEQLDAATKLGLAAVRYFDMKQNRTSAYVFNYDRMLDSKGNTAVYLFYAYARICSVQRKAGVDTKKLAGAKLAMTKPQERDLALCLLRFPEVIEAILGNLHLHQLAEYLWELCTLLTSFYQNCKVIGTPEQESRLMLCEACRIILHTSFDLFGFSPLDKI